MYTAPDGIAGATARRVPLELVGVTAAGPVKSHVAALSARSVAGDTASPVLGVAWACGVLGGRDDCESESIARRVGPACWFNSSELCTGCVESPGLCVEVAELVKENAGGSLKTGAGGLTWSSISWRPLDFFGGCFADGVLPSFGGLPRFLGTISALAASGEVVVDDFFGLPRFLGAVSAAAVVSESSPWSISGVTSVATCSDAAVATFDFLWRFGGSGATRNPCGRPCSRKQLST
jgi:hypothetical protein